MDREDKDSIQQDYIDKLLQKIYGYTDEQILKDFEEAEKDDGSYPDFPEYPDEFDRIWEDIQAERAERMKSEPEEEAATVVEPPRKVRKIRWKRVAITGIAACLVALSVCFVAVGKKSYFYREREREGIRAGLVLNNDDYVVAVDSLVEAYDLIEKECEMRPLRLAYMPQDMVFKDLIINDKSSTIEFNYDDGIAYLVQSKNGQEASVNYKSDEEDYTEVYNKWLQAEFKVKKEVLPDKKIRYEAQMVKDGIFYMFSGAIEEAEFFNIIERCIF